MFDHLKAVLKRYTYESELEQEVSGSCLSLLDLGCGVNSPISRFKRKIPHTVGVDGFESALNESCAKGIHDSYHMMNVLEAASFFGARSFDCVLASDLIEHLEKPDGLRLIKQMEAISRKKVVILTPNGFVPQGENDGNTYQRHLSGWHLSEMKQLGYRVIGLSGWKPLRGEYAQPRFKPERLWNVISLLTQPIVRNRPERAFQLLCIKDIGDCSKE